ncbi:MAG TPA: hypothetical protein VF857_01665 [Spirochaetota bacterium]
MSRLMRAVFVIVLGIALLPGALFAEYVYLKDGQVIQGKIVNEDQREIVVQTKFQKRTIRRDDILRIMYGERKMEKIYLLMNDGTTRIGYKVDEDATQVLIRESENSPKEISISKSDIKQMSGSEIVPLDPSIFVRSGVFVPVNSKGAKLKPALCFFAGSDLNFQWINNLRVFAEAGYAKNTSSHKGLYMQFIPIQVSAIYDITLSHSFHIMPRLGLGATIIDFDDGEVSKTRSVAGSGVGGVGFVYEVVDRHFYVGLWGDYWLMRDKSSTLHGYAGTLGISYRF